VRATELEARLNDLEESLGVFKATDYAPWQVAVIYNALLEQAKKEDGDDPAVAALEPATQAGGMGDPRNESTARYGELRAAIKQIIAAIGGSGAPDA
jgi:hypothetical protein